MGAAPVGGWGRGRGGRGGAGAKGRVHRPPSTVTTKVSAREGGGRGRWCATAPGPRGSGEVVARRFYSPVLTPLLLPPGAGPHSRAPRLRSGGVGGWEGKRPSSQGGRGGGARGGARRLPGQPSSPAPPNPHPILGRLSDGGGAPLRRAAVWVLATEAACFEPSGGGCCLLACRSTDSCARPGDEGMAFPRDGGGEWEACRGVGSCLRAWTATAACWVAAEIERRLAHRGGRAGGGWVTDNAALRCLVPAVEAGGPPVHLRRGRRRPSTPTVPRWAALTPRAGQRPRRRWGGGCRLGLGRHRPDIAVARAHRPVRQCTNYNDAGENYFRLLTLVCTDSCRHAGSRQCFGSTRRQKCKSH